MYYIYMYIIYMYIYICIYIYIYVYIYTYVALDTYLDLLKMIFNCVPDGKSNTWEIYRAPC